MSIDAPAVAASELAQTSVAAEPAKTAWIGTAVAVTFTVAAVLIVSFVAVITGLA